MRPVSRCEFLSKLLICLMRSVLRIIVLIIACCFGFFWPLWDLLSKAAESYNFNRKLFINTSYGENARQYLLLSTSLGIIYTMLVLVVVVAGIIMSALWWMYCVLFIIFGYLLRGPLYSSFCDLFQILRFIVMKLDGKNNENFSSIDEYLCQIIAVIIVTPLLWFLPLAVFFSLNFIIHTIQIIGK